MNSEERTKDSRYFVNKVDKYTSESKVMEI